MPTNAMAHIEELIADFEPQLRDAFLASMDDLRSNADLRRVAAALEAGKVTPAAFGPLDRARTEAFQAAADSTVAGLPTIRDPDGTRVGCSLMPPR